MVSVHTARAVRMAEQGESKLRTTCEDAVTGINNLCPRALKPGESGNNGRACSHIMSLHNVAPEELSAPQRACDSTFFYRTFGCMEQIPGRQE